ncbi:MAG: radical SAM family heme chaperone HemW [Oscillospiraceae bacterium]|nr:radical SAM family heme chaperone HemW [Oscillospiraceae bacterium]
MSGYPQMIREKVSGIYIHVPFCTAKCPYCNFYSVPAEESLMDAYTRQLCRALEQAAARWPSRADSLYFGGGTPILLGARRIDKILETARRHFGLTAAEITLEANPAATLEETLRELYAAGVTRLSFGMQSADEGELRLLGRRHTAAEAALAVSHAQKAGFTNLSLDLMLGIPQQTAQSVEKSVAFCAETGVSHISAYLLKVEAGTPFDRDGVAARCLDPDGQADLYLRAVEVLARHGFLQYEISNFAKPGFHSRHNCKYWLGAAYLGLGPAAHSLMAGRRLFFPRDLGGFLAAEDPLSLLQDDGPGGGPAEFALLGLRLCQGIDRAEAASRYPDYDWDGLWQKSRPMLAAGYMRLENNRLAFTPAGFLLSNSILARIL